MRTRPTARRTTAFLSMSEDDKAPHIPTLTYSASAGAQPLSWPSPHQLAALLASKGPRTDCGDGGGFNGTGRYNGGGGGGDDNDHDQSPWEGEDRHSEIMLYVLVTLCMYAVAALVAIRSWWKGNADRRTPFATLTASITAARRPPRRVGAA
jgi:hypothetical protein